MTKDRINSIEDALAYLVDCTLATVEDFCLKKRVVKSDFERHILIAQTALDSAVRFGSNLSGTRGEEIVSTGLTVEQWAEQMRNHFHPEN